MDRDKQKIIKLFNKNVKGKKPDTTNSNNGHDGKSGHWLEKQMGIDHNANTKADLLGYEMKNDTKSKTSYGDWMADYYLYKDKSQNLTKNDFITMFGTPKNDRYSWSGSVCPKRATDAVNVCGQKLYIDEENNVLITYSYSKDFRTTKDVQIPRKFCIDNVIIAKWDNVSLRKKVEDKFNQKGWFKCLTDKSGLYTEIVFGAPMTFETWLDAVRAGDIYFDSGMVYGKSRSYSAWRANNSYWKSLITDRH